MRTLLDRQATGEISEAEADEIHETMMQNLELNFLVRQNRIADKVYEAMKEKPSPNK